MNLEHRTQDGVDIVKLPERLMMADAADARASIKDIISSGSGKLVLDLLANPIEIRRPQASRQ